jgi:hypothetical protein
VAEGTHNVDSAHVADLQDQLRGTIADGMASGDFKISNAETAAAGLEAAARAVIRLLLAGLAAGSI